MKLCSNHLIQYSITNIFFQGAEVDNKISEIANILTTLNQSSAEYQLISSVHNMLQNITNLLQTRRFKRNNIGKIFRYFWLTCFKTLTILDKIDIFDKIMDSDFCMTSLVLSHKVFWFVFVFFTKLILNHY